MGSIALVEVGHTATLMDVSRAAFMHVRHTTSLMHVGGLTAFVDDDPIGSAFVDNHAIRSTLVNHYSIRATLVDDHPIRRSFVHDHPLGGSFAHDNPVRAALVDDHAIGLAGNYELRRSDSSFNNGAPINAQIRHLGNDRRLYGLHNRCLGHR